MLDFLPVYLDTLEALEELSDEQQMRLIRAMTRYAVKGEEPEFERGTPERMLWKAMKQRVDSASRSHDKKVKAGGAGGDAKAEANRSKQPAAEDSTAKQNVAERSTDEQNVADDSKAYPKAKAKAKAKAEDKAEANKSTERAREAEARFDRFWKAYPRKTAKQDAAKAFARLNPDEALLETMLSALEKQKQSAQWTRDGGQYIPHPATWINGKRWTDEVTQARAAPLRPVSAQQYDQREYVNAPAEEMPPWLVKNLANDPAFLAEHPDFLTKHPEAKEYIA